MSRKLVSISGRGGLGADDANAATTGPLSYITAGTDLFTDIFTSLVNKKSAEQASDYALKAKELDYQLATANNQMIAAQTEAQRVQYELLMQQLEAQRDAAISAAENLQAVSASESYRVTPLGYGVIAIAVIGGVALLRGGKRVRR